MKYLLWKVQVLRKSCSKDQTRIQISKGVLLMLLLDQK